MGEIWANKLLPKALKSCPKSNKSPDLVTLEVSRTKRNVFTTEVGHILLLPCSKIYLPMLVNV